MTDLLKYTLRSVNPGSWPEGVLHPAAWSWEPPQDPNHASHVQFLRQNVTDWRVYDLYRAVLETAINMTSTDGEPLHGTIGGRRMSNPVQAGAWHRDTGHATLRVAVTWALDMPDLACGHETRQGITPSGEMLLFTTEEHRCPKVPVKTPRLFVSAAVYRQDQEKDLSCVLLERLRPS